MRRPVITTLVTVSAIFGASHAGLASFSGTDLILPSVGSAPGVAPSVWYTTVWVYNPNPTNVQAEFQFLERNKSNTSPLTLSDTIPAGDVRQYDDAVFTMFGVKGFGAIRVVAAAKLAVSARIYSKAASEQERDSKGQLFAGIPASFAIGLGQSTDLLGATNVLPPSTADYRYNVGFVETTGAAATVRVAAVGETGSDWLTTTVQLQPFEQKQYSVADVFSGGLGTGANFRLRCEVTAGSGKIVAFASRVANGSQDPTTFEMTFRDELLGGGGSGGSIVHDTTLSGDGTAASPLGIANAGVTPPKISAVGSQAGQVLTSSGSSVSWQTPSGGGSGISAVSHDASLSGDGTMSSPLAVAAGGVTAQRLSPAGSTSGQVLTSTGGAVSWQTPSSGGMSSVSHDATLSGDGTSGSPLALANDAVTEPKIGAVNAPSGGMDLEYNGSALEWKPANGHHHLRQSWDNGAYTEPALQIAGAVPWGNGLFKVYNNANGPSVWGVNTQGGNAVRGDGYGTSIGVYGEGADGPAVVGRSSKHDGVQGHATAANRSGVYATGVDGYGLAATSQHNAAIYVPGAGSTGIVVNSAGGHGVAVGSANANGLFIQSAGQNAIKIDSAGHSAIYIDSATYDGLRFWDTIGRDYIRAGTDTDLYFRVTKSGAAYADGGWNGAADFAELMSSDTVDAAPEPGDVVVASCARDRSVALSSEPYQSSVIGVYSTRPGFIGSARPSLEREPGELPIAIVGIVPTRVSAENGAIGRGDLLVTSSTPGHAMRAVDPPTGTVVGKALGELTEGLGVIEVLVTLQ